MVGLDQTVGDAVRQMREQDTGCVLVCDESRRLVGIFTERDLLRRVMAQGKSLSTPVSHVMTPDPVVVGPKEPIGNAIRRMEEGGYRNLPVVNDGEPVGVVSVKQIVHYLVEHYSGTVYNLPPDPGAVQQEREGA
jgi:CBS domain-containing protein